MIKDVIAGNQSVKANSRKMDVLHNNFAGCFDSEGNFDLERFKELMRDEVNFTSEGYSLNFLGKDYANLIASLDTTTVVVPDEEHNSKPENKDSENVYISGDNLDALKHLLKSYAGQVKCIYIDPPYNTGTDGFVYNDRFTFTSEQLQKRLGVDEEEARRILEMTSRGSSSHSAWLMFMSPRLQLARQLLSKDGVIFISIDDNEQANLKLLCDYVFGEENFVAQIPWRKRTAKSDVPFGVSQDYEWILAYARSDEFMSGIESKGRKYYETPDFPGRPWRMHDMTTQRTAVERPNCYFTIKNPKTGEEFPANSNRVWANNEETFKEYYEDNRIIFPGDYDFLNISKPVLRYWKEDDIKKAGDKFGQISVTTKLPDKVGMSQDGTKEVTSLFGAKVFSYPKPTSLIKYLLEISNAEDAIVVDFFSGSATTADALMQLNVEKNLNLKYILVQWMEECPEKSEAYNAGYRTIDQVGQERIKLTTAKIKAENPLFAGDLGFKHYTLQEVPENVLDKMEEFSLAETVFANGMLELFGRETVLATWKVRDGYGLTTTTETVQLADYTAYQCGDHLYLLDEGLNVDAVTALVDKYGEPTPWNPHNVVAFGYNMNYAMMDALRTNLPLLNEGEKQVKINIDVRY